MNIFLQTDHPLLKFQKFFGIKINKINDSPPNQNSKQKIPILNQSFVLIKPDSLYACACTNQNKSIVAIEHQNTIYTYKIQSIDGSQDKQIIFFFLQSTMRPQIKDVQGLRVLKQLKFFQDGYQFLLISIMGSFALIFDCYTGRQIFDIPVYRTLVNVKQIEYFPSLKVLIILGRNYHQTFDIITVVKLFSDLLDDKNLLIMKNNQCLSFVISRSALFQRYIEQENLYNKLLVHDQIKHEDVLLKHDDFSTINYAQFFQKQGRPMLLLGCNLKNEIFILNFNTILHVIKYDLAPNFLKYDNIQEVIPITEVQAYFPNIQFTGLSIQEENNQSVNFIIKIIIFFRF